jgi:hypothetical protein
MTLAAGGSVACGLDISTNHLQLSCLGIKLDVVGSLGELCPVQAPELERKIVPIFNQWWQLVCGIQVWWIGATK